MDQVLRRGRPATLNVPDAPAIIRPEREAVTAAVADARLTFAVLLAWGSAATAATLTARLKRSIT